MKQQGFRSENHRRDLRKPVSEERRRAAQKRESRGRWKLILSFSFFGLCTAVGISNLLVGWTDPISATVFTAFSGGFLLMGCSLLPVVRRGRGAQQGANPLMWVFVLLGILLWCAVPFFMLLNGQGWSDPVFRSNSYRNPPIWFVALVVWGVGALVVFALIMQLLRRKARRRGSGGGGGGDGTSSSSGGSEATLRRAAGAHGTQRDLA